MMRVDNKVEPISNIDTKSKIDYRKSSIRSLPCIILDPKFPRLVLEVL